MKEDYLWTKQSEGCIYDLQNDWQLKKLRQGVLWSDVYSVSLFFVLEKIISAVDEVMENTALLDNIKSEKELEQVMPVLLASLGKYAQADRSYIFELKPDSTDILHMTHVWCAEGISPTFRETQNRIVSKPAEGNWRSYQWIERESSYGEDARGESTFSAKKPGCP